MSKTLLVIDIQNDYFPDGHFPLWNTDVVLANTVAAIAQARVKGVPVVLVQHVADVSKGPAPFFNPGTPGVALHPGLHQAAEGAPLVMKHFADSFHHTRLEETLSKLGCKELLVCGMMTQNCVTHTALSKSAEKYKVTVLTDCCTTVSQMLHLIALNALSTRVGLKSAAEAL